MGNRTWVFSTAFLQQITSLVNAGKLESGL